jgi:MFS superfamily sulfate permease-like transporter/mannitol/fructose-specific phosphotransferase system IIA component (Ntr-type)
VNETDSTSTPRRVWLPDFLASTVVFLVALPLCIGIAVACGVPAERGLVTGIIGGIVVGVFSGAPLLVSGPAASLIVPVVDLVHEYGLVALAPVVALAGVWQTLAGVLRLGRWFRAVAPAVIVGMLIGIGVLIFIAELHVCLDAEPRGGFTDNLLALPESLAPALTGRASVAPLLISLATIVVIVAWPKVRPSWLSLVPGQLTALVIVMVAAAVLRADVLFLEISPNFFDGLSLATPADFGMLRDPKLIGLSLIFAFVASAATLLTANAIDQQQTRSKANYDREMLAQGIGNMLTGAVGGLPMTGVIVRSAVNVDAGAQTRVSTILHGIWILLFVVAAPEVLELIPQASLGAILVYTGYKLMDRQALMDLYKQGRSELAISLITLFGVVFIDLFAGIMAGLAAALGKIVYTFARLEVRSEPGRDPGIQDLHLTGSATFLQIPRLAAALDEVPPDRELHVHIDLLDHIDHACLQLLSSWGKRRESEGLPGMVVEWDELTERYRNALVGTGIAPTEGPRQSIMGLVWEEWRSIYAPTTAANARPGAKWEDFVDADRACVRVDAKSLDDVIEAAAPGLARAADRPIREIVEALRSRIEGQVALGGGISVPHAPISGLDRSLAALVTTREPVTVAGEEADVFFVLLAPSDEPKLHLQALAHVGRLCHDRMLVEALRDAASAEEAAEFLRRADRSVLDTDTGLHLDARLMAVIECEEADRADHMANLVAEAFGRAHVTAPDDGASFRALRRVLRFGPAARVVVTVIEERDVIVLHRLLDEEQRVVGGGRARVHLLRPEATSRAAASRPARP